MPDIFKPTCQVRVPASTTIRVSDGKRIARFKDKTGRWIEGEIRSTGRVTVPAKKWYTRVEYADGSKRRVALVTDAEASRQMAARIQKDAYHQAAGVVVGHKRTLWADFRKKFEKEVLPARAAKTAMMFATLLNEIEETIKPVRLCDVSAVALSKLQTSWRSRELAESSIRSYLCHLSSGAKMGGPAANDRRRADNRKADPQPSTR